MTTVTATADYTGSDPVAGGSATASATYSATTAPPSGTTVTTTATYTAVLPSGSASTTATYTAYASGATATATYTAQSGAQVAYVGVDGQWRAVTGYVGVAGSGALGSNTLGSTALGGGQADAWVPLSYYIGASGAWLNLATVPVTPPPDPGGGGTTNPRDSLTYGTYQPDATTAGLRTSTSQLTELNSPTATTFTLNDGDFYQNQIIYGDITYNGTGGARLENCWLRGGNNVPSGSVGIVSTERRPGGGTNYLTIIDCLIEARQPSNNRDGIRGHHLRAYRNEVRLANDGIVPFIYPANGTSADTILAGNWVHKMAYLYPDYQNGVSGAAYHVDGSHGDGIPYQGGTDVWILGNFVDGTDSVCFINTSAPNAGINPRKEWMSGLYLLNGYTYGTGGAIFVNGNVNTAMGSSVILDSNYLRGFQATINVKATPGGPFVVRNNRHFYDSASRPTNWASLPGNSGAATWVSGDTFPPGVTAGYPRNEQLFKVYIRGDSKSNAVVTGVNSGTVTDTFVDGPNAGKTLTESTSASSGAGIYWDAQ